MTESASQTSLSVLVPVYNEQHLIEASLGRLRVLASSPGLERVEVIVVDDCSTDATPRVLETFAARTAAQAPGPISWRFLRHERNGGKGMAIRTALEAATCDICVIHDADLEYHPKDLLRIVQVFIDEPADAVFGSRFAGSEVRRVLLYRHQLGNKLLTFLCNLVTNLNLTDMETCYKAVRTDLLKSIPIVSNDFRLEPELTIKLAKRRARIFEIPISYSGRTYYEGKKIGWRDGVRAIAAIVRFALSDEIYKEDAHGSQILARLSRAPRFNAWMADVIRPFCGNRVLEIGGGVGNLTLQLVPRWTFVVSDINPLYLQTLKSLRLERPYLQVQHCDVTDISTFPQPPDGYDTAICLNVIEHISGDREAMRNIRSVLAPDGRAIILVPQGQWNFGTLDQVLGHERRYSRESLIQLAHKSGFEVERLLEFNRLGTLAWFLNGKVLKRHTFSLVQIKLLNWLVPLMRAFDALLPLPALSLIAILRPASGAATQASLEALPEDLRAALPSGPRPPHAAAVRSWIAMACLLALLATGWASRQRAEKWLTRALPSQRAMCAELPAYDTFAGSVDPASPLVIAIPPGPRQVERKFCAQFALTPTPLQLIETVDPDVLLSRVQAGPVLIDDAYGGTTQPATREAIDQVLRATTTVISKESADGLVLLSSIRSGSR